MISLETLYDYKKGLEGRATGICLEALDSHADRYCMVSEESLSLISCLLGTVMVDAAGPSSFLIIIIT